MKSPSPKQQQTPPQTYKHTILQSEDIPLPRNLPPLHRSKSLKLKGGPKREKAENMEMEEPRRHTPLSYLSNHRLQPGTKNEPSSKRGTSPFER